MEKTLTYKLIADKEPSAVKELYERYGKKLAGFAVHQWKVDVDSAWDLVYKTLFKVMETSANYTFANEQKFSAFVFTLFINYLRNHYRDSKKFPQYVDELNETIVGSATLETSNPSEAVTLLSDELDKLEDWERILLLMRCQNVAYTEIAKLTGKTEDNLKVYYGRLKKKLQVTLSEKISALKKQST